jgi:hypothetical protein
MTMMMMMCLKYRAQKFFGLEKLFFENLSKGRRKDKIADELHKGTKIKKKVYSKKKILRLSNAEECEQRRFFV